MTEKEYLEKKRKLELEMEKEIANIKCDKFNHSVKFIASEGVDENVLKIVENSYFKAIEKGAKPEDARQILPNCTASTIVVTGTIKDWKNFLHLRVDEHAQKEIREIAKSVMSYLHLTKLDIGL